MEDLVLNELKEISTSIFSNMNTDVHHDMLGRVWFRHHDKYPVEVNGDMNDTKFKEILDWLNFRGIDFLYCATGITHISTAESISIFTFKFKTEQDALLFNLRI